jgi:hypothetical protein
LQKQTGSVADDPSSWLPTERVGRMWAAMRAEKPFAAGE